MDDIHRSGHAQGQRQGWNAGGLRCIQHDGAFHNRAARDGDQLRGDLGHFAGIGDVGQGIEDDTGFVANIDIAVVEWIHIDGQLGLAEVGDRDKCAAGVNGIPDRVANGQDGPGNGRIQVGVCQIVLGGLQVKLGLVESVQAGAGGIGRDGPAGQGSQQVLVFRDLGLVERHVGLG